MSDTNNAFAGLKDLPSVVSAEAATPKREPKRDAQGRSYSTGRRKNAIARVWIKPGKGDIMVNGKKAPVYFARPVLRMLIDVYKRQGLALAAALAVPLAARGQ